MQKFIFIVAFLLAVVVSSASAFTSMQPWGRRRFVRFMFSTDENEVSRTAVSAPSIAQPLATLDETLISSNVPPILTSTPVERPKMLAKNMNTGEVKEVNWVDPAMAAHTNPLQMDWYVGLSHAFIDAYHFSTL
jgi:hypothetical protein